MLTRLRRAFRRRFPLTLHRAIGLVFAMVVLPLALGCIALVTAQWRHERAVVAQQMQSLAIQLAHGVDLHYTQARSQLEALAVLPALDQRDLTLAYRHATEVSAGRPGSLIALTGPDGQMLFNSLLSFGVPLPNLWALDALPRTTRWNGHELPVSSRGMTRQVFRTGRPAYSPLFVGLHSGQPTLALAIPVRQGGRIAYALSMSFPAKELREVLAVPVLPDRARVVLLDAQGRVVTSNTPTRYPVGLPLEPARAAGARPAQPVQLTDVAGRRLDTVSATSNAGLTVLLGVPPGVYNSAENVAAAWALLLLTGFLLSIAATAWLSRRFAGPLRALAESAREGRVPAEVPSGLAEIDALADALHKAAEIEQLRREEQVRRVAAEQTQDAMRRSELRIRRVFDGMYCFVCVLDAQGCVVEANHAPVRRAGLHRGEVIGRPLWDCYWWNHDEGLQKLLRAAVADARSGHLVRFDVSIRLEGGRLVPIDFQLAPLHDVGGEVRELVASAVDIEERVEAVRRLGEQRWLLDAALEATPAGIIVTDVTGRMLRANQANEQLWGSAPPNNDAGGHPNWRGWWSVGHPREGEAVHADEWPLARALRNAQRETSVIDIEPFDAPGARKTALISASPVLDEQGNVVGGVVVQTDITERTLAEAALREADRNKDAFLATLGHELRNPLAPIRTAVEILRRTMAAEPAAQRAQQVIERQVEHMTRLVDDLLDVSRITRGLIRIQREPVSLQQVLAMAVEAAMPAVAGAGVQLVQDLASEPLNVLGDPTRLSQSVLNLLTNACKFTPRGGTVRLRLRRAGDQGVVEVQDSGIGLAPESLERIFGLFVQVQVSGGGGNSGLGIGLALARQLVRMHGGDVAAASQGLGQGSTFTLTLPLAQVQPAPEAPPQPQRQAEDSRRRTVLVVDDNQDGCDALRELLQMSGFEVRAAYDGAGALAALAQDPVDAVVLDIGLPDMSGYEVCRRIRSSCGRAPVVVALTGWGQPQDKSAAREAGFDAHLTKPADPATMAQLLRRLLARREGAPTTRPSPLALT